MTDRDEDLNGHDPEMAEAETHAAVETVGDEAGEGEGSVEVEELRAELDMLNDRHLRLAAEFDNYRKRNERERGRQAALMQADLVAGFLDVLDDLERVTSTGDEATLESMVEGAELVIKKFRTTLETAGLEPLDAEGKPFDPETMEALMTVPTAEEEQHDHVADVFQKGYRFRDILVRPARVRVYAYDPAAEDAD